MEKFLEENKWPIGLVIVGSILIGLGALGFKIFDFSSGEPKVEILPARNASNLPADEAVLACVAGGGSENCETGKITVEAAGEVERPGVYEMAVDSRVNDLLTLAGGLSANADREWVAKNINLAQRLVDGAKIYIPSINEVGSGKIEAGKDVGSGISEKININTATISELDTLWGIGEATAKKIIEGRPYQKPEELLQKKIVKSNVWEEIKDEITVY